MSMSDLDLHQCWECGHQPGSIRRLSPEWSQRFHGILRDLTGSNEITVHWVESASENGSFWLHMQWYGGRHGSGHQSTPFRTKAAEMEKTLKEEFKKLLRGAEVDRDHAQSQIRMWTAVMERSEAILSEWGKVDCHGEE